VQAARSLQVGDLTLPSAADLHARNRPLR
jgi:hypothetical protein